MQPTTDRLPVHDPDEREPIRESGDLGLVCFPSEAVALSEPERLSWGQQFQGLPTHVRFYAYYQAGLELGKARTRATVAASGDTSTPLSLELVKPTTYTTTSAEVLETRTSATSSISIVYAPSRREREWSRPQV